MTQSPNLNSHFIHVLYNALIQQGIAESQARLILNVSQQELDNSDLRIRLDRLLEMWHKAIDYTDNPLLGLETGCATTYAQYGIIGHMAIASDTLVQALELGLAYEHIINSSFNTRLIHTEDSIINRLECHHVDPQPLAPLVECDFASLMYFARSLVSNAEQANVYPQEIHFKHRPLGPIERYEALLHCPVYFEQPYNQMLISPDVLSMRTMTADSGLLALILKRMESLDESLRSGQNALAEQIRRYMTEQLPSGLPNANETAAHFAISTSTLKRRLTQEGTSFLGIATQVKKEVAIALLEEATPIAEIALLLGFSETSAFTRAFKKWTGTAPSKLNTSDAE